MVLHAAVMMAFFMDQLTNAPIQVQCLQQATQEPGWRWWFGALAPWVGPLLSGVVSIYVAWRVFRWQGEKDHTQWILDQKAVEWRTLILDSNKAVSQIHNLLSKTQIRGPFDVRSSEDQIEITKEFREASTSARELLQRQILIRCGLIDSGITGLWDAVSRVLVSISMTGDILTSPEHLRAFTGARDSFFDALYRVASNDLGLPRTGQITKRTEDKNAKQV